MLSHNFNLMKKFMFVLLLAIVAMVTPTSCQPAHEFPTVFQDENGAQYGNSFDEIWDFHESDIVFLESMPDSNGNWVAIYYNDTEPNPELYIYNMVWDKCYQRTILKDSSTIAYMTHWLKETDVSE